MYPYVVFTPLQNEKDWLQINPIYENIFPKMGVQIFTYGESEDVLHSLLGDD